jgi:NADH oxidase (H2O2-forming)
VRRDFRDGRNMKGRERVVILGNGVAGNTALEAIHRNKPLPHVVMLSEEPYPEYSACVLPQYISGDLERRRIFLKSLKDYQGVKTRFGEKVCRIDLAKGRVFLEKGNIPYDRLIIATGGEPMMPSIGGINGKGICSLKTLADADRLARTKAKSVVVIGSGLIGVEAAVALKKKGHKVCLIGRRNWILPRILDEDVGRRAQKILERNGIKVLTGETVKEILRGREVRAVQTEARKIPCDLVVIATGIKPRVDLAVEAGIDIGPLGGIKVNERMETSHPNIYACGDCAESVNPATGKTSLQLRWFNARQMGRLAGLNCMDIKSTYEGTPVGVVLNLFGIAVGSLGQLSQNLKGREVEVLKEDSEGFYIQVLITEDAIAGAQFIGGTEEAGILFTAIQNRLPLRRLSEGFIPFPWYHKLDRYLKSSLYGD